MYDIEGWTDMLPEFGGDSYTKADNYMTGRANGVATYRNTDFFGLVDGLNFALQYQARMKTRSPMSKKVPQTVVIETLRTPMATVLASPLPTT